MCVGIATNNQDEYDGVTGLPTVVLHLGICHLYVFLDSQRLVSQLNNYYLIRDPCLFIKFMCIRNLVRNFESIKFMHVTRSLNSVAEQMDNDVL